MAKKILYINFKYFKNIYLSRGSRLDNDRFVTGISICLLLISSYSLMIHPFNDMIRAEDATKTSPDSIDINLRIDIEDGIGDVANGTLDVFLQDISGKEYGSLSPDVKDKTGTWKQEYGYTNIYFNPAHTVSPYECSLEDKIKFNPFAIKELRYAANHLLNRSKVVDDIYDGHAEPRYLPFSQSSPSYRNNYDQIVENRALTAGGNKQKGKMMVNHSLMYAMNDPLLKGELRAPLKLI